MPVATPLAVPSLPSGRRIAAIWLPFAALERRRLSGPAALWAAVGGRHVITAATPAALAAGISPGQALADATAILPDLTLHPANPEGDAAWLRRLGHWAHVLTPLPALDPPDGLLLDVTGLAPLHGNEARLRTVLLGRFTRAGLTARIAIAGNIDAAAALARAGSTEIVPTGGEAAALAPLPLSALRLPAAQIAALHRLGLREVGALLAQPRAPLARRFGVALLATLDAATGARPRPLQPLRLPAEFRALRNLAEPITARPAIEAVLAALLETLCAQLQAAGLGARRLLLQAWRVDGTVQAIALGTGLPARVPRHLARLFQEKLDRLDPGFGFELLSLEARVTAPMVPAQAALPGENGSAPEGRAQDLAELLDRLGQRLPVWRLAPRTGHWPERAVARVDAFASILTPADWPGLAARPIRLLRRPLRLSAVALLPDAPPSLLRLGTTSWRVMRAEGPERLAPEWWHDRPDRPQRDYYRVELASGARLWVCRAGPPGEAAPWWLHGRFA
jgi:protein ImuB